MGKRHYLSFLLLSFLAVLSCSNAPGTSSIFGNCLFQLSENLNFDRDDYDALFSNKRILLASGTLIKNERTLVGSDFYEPQNENPVTQLQKEKSAAAPKKGNTFIFGGAAYLLVGKV